MAPGEIAGLLWIGIFSSGIGYLCRFLALKDGDTAKMSNIAFLTPVLSMIPILLLLGGILPPSVIGLALIIAGIIIQSARARATISEQAKC
ncbi:MAG: EamA family transporter [Candidatus Micrarchaeota archaeon]